MAYEIGRKAHARGQDWTIEKVDRATHTVSLKRDDHEEGDDVGKTIDINYIYERDDYFFVYPEKELMCCYNCYFYSDSTCRRHAPAPALSTTFRSVLWPDVGRTDWCGEFKKDEE